MCARTENRVAEEIVAEYQWLVCISLQRILTFARAVLAIPRFKEAGDEVPVSKVQHRFQDVDILGLWGWCEDLAASMFSLSSSKLFYAVV